MTAALVWKAGVVRLLLTVPAGWHVNEEAPLRLTVGSATVVTAGSPAALRLPVHAGVVEATLDVAVCTDDGSVCRPTTLHGQGTLGRGTRVELTEAAVAASASSSGRVAKLLDFSAVWCPPCNQLAAEVLDGPVPWPVETIDVDDVASWGRKSQYHVGGYPTLVAVDAAGNEVARQVGYSGRDATLAWFTRVDGPPPAGAAGARQLAEAGDEAGARKLLVDGDDSVDAHVARLVLDGQKADADWLVAHHATGTWAPMALAADPGLLPQLATALAALPPATAADGYFGAADTDAPNARFWLGGALVLVGAAHTGDPHHDRAFATEEAEALAGLGRLDDAIGLLDHYATLFPDEFTWDQAAAGHYLDASRWVDAEARARKALALARGDQRYRAAMGLAKALAGQGRRPEAAAVLDAVLAELPAPSADVDVRTHRYRKQCTELRATLGS